MKEAAARTIPQHSNAAPTAMAIGAIRRAARARPAKCTSVKLIEES
jgi:hypothetical protein